MSVPYDVSYKNASGVVTNLTAPPFSWGNNDLHDYKWDYSFIKNSVGLGSAIKNITKSGRVYRIILNVFYSSSASIVATLNALHATFEADLLAETPGRLYIDTQYVTGYFVESAKPTYINGRIAVLDLAFVTGSPFWITEELLSFPIFTDYGATGFILPMAVPFGLVATLDSRQVINDHYAASGALITMYGPVTDPSFTVGTHIYTVSGTLGAGERYEINQRLRTVTKITSSGERINAFNSRGKTYSVFEPIPSGESILYYNGDFAVDIVLLKERSEPLWAS